MLYQLRNSHINKYSEIFHRKYFLNIINILNQFIAHGKMKIILIISQC